jgi:transposase
MTPAGSAEEAIKDIRRAARRHWSAEDKIRIVLPGSGIQDNLADKARALGIPVWRCGG